MNDEADTFQEGNLSAGCPDPELCSPLCLCGYCRARHGSRRVASVSGTITSAEFDVALGPPAFGSGPSPVTLELFAYSGSISDLDSGSAGVAGFNALGSGTLLGSMSANTSDTGTLSIALNGSAVAAIQAAEGGNFAVGGRVLGTPPTDYLFGNSIDTAQTTLRLGTSAVPEPGSVVLLAIALAMIATTARRRRRLPS